MQFTPYHNGSRKLEIGPIRLLSYDFGEKSKAQLMFRDDSVVGWIPIVVKTFQSQDEAEAWMLQQVSSIKNSIMDAETAECERKEP